MRLDLLEGVRTLQWSGLHSSHASGITDTLIIVSVASLVALGPPTAGTPDPHDDHETAPICATSKGSPSGMRPSTPPERQNTTSIAVPTGREPELTSVSTTHSRNCSGSRCDPAVVGRSQSCLAAWSADATVDPADGLTTPAITSKAGAAGTRASKAVLPLMVAATTRVRRRPWPSPRWAPSA